MIDLSIFIHVEPNSTNILTPTMFQVQVFVCAYDKPGLKSNNECRNVFLTIF